MVKKIVVAAAGRGTRMKKLTKNQPKHILPVLGRPFILYLLDHIKEAGFEEIFVVTGFYSEKIEPIIKKYDPEIKIVNQFKKLGRDVYGTACPIKAVEEKLADDQFVQINGDSLFSAQDLKKLAIQDRYCYVGAIESDCPEKYGIVIEENGILKEIIEKPKNPPTNLVNCGCYKFTPKIFELIKKVDLSKRGEYELTDAINLAIKEKEVKVAKLADYWFDFGCPEDIKKIEKFKLSQEE
jgi:NDP-sugar pyrophosphorylase family protein